MDPLKPRRRRGPESIIVDELRTFLHLRDWYTIKTHGSEYQSGLPDLYCCHKRYGARWIEVKNAEKYSFTSAQMDVFPKLIAHGVGVWILTAATEAEYRKIFGPSNWYTYLSIMKV
jgi:hypothetical protein